jgi:hypothetical protein
VRWIEVMKVEKPKPIDEPIKLPDDPEAVLRAMLKVDPDSEPVEESKPEDDG